MKTIKLLFIALITLLASCSPSEDINDITDYGNSGETTENITTTSGVLVSKVYLETSWVLESRDNGYTTTTQAPCGQSEFGTTMDFRQNGTVDKNIMLSSTCQPTKIQGTYDINGSVLRTSIGNEVHEYDIINLTSNSMRVGIETNGEYYEMSYQNQGNPNHVTDELFMGDWELVSVMEDYTPVLIDDRMCGSRIESMSIHYLDATNNSGLANMFIVGGDCPNAIDETVSYQLDMYQADTDGYEYNDHRLTFTLSSGVIIEYFIEEMSFYDDNELLAETMTVLYYHNNITYRLAFERPFN